jgi:hypothetical protein
MPQRTPRRRRSLALSSPVSYVSYPLNHQAAAAVSAIITIWRSSITPNLNLSAIRGEHNAKEAPPAKDMECGGRAQPRRRFLRPGLAPKVACPSRGEALAFLSAPDISGQMYAQVGSTALPLMAVALLVLSPLRVLAAGEQQFATPESAVSAIETEAGRQEVLKYQWFVQSTWGDSQGRRRLCVGHTGVPRRIS